MKLIIDIIVIFIKVIIIEIMKKVNIYIKYMCIVKKINITKKEKTSNNNQN